MAENLAAGQVFPPEIGIEDSVVARVGLGQYIGCWRMEGEIGFREHDVNDIVLSNENYFHVQGERQSTTGMFNLFRDFNHCGRIRPYAKGGIGMSYNESTGSRFVNPVGSQSFQGDVFPGDHSWEFAWSVGGGLGICLTRNLLLDLEYQYIELGGTATAANSMGSALGLGQGWAHELTMGFRVNF